VDVDKPDQAAGAQDHLLPAALDAGPGLEAPDRPLRRIGTKASG
jgi:hypothetical protein